MAISVDRRGIRHLLLCITAASLLGEMAAFLLFPAFWFLPPLVLGPIALASVCFLRTCRWSISKDFLLLRRGFFFPRETLVPLAQVRAVSQISTPYLRHHSLCFLRIFTANRRFWMLYLPQQLADSIRTALCDTHDVGETP